MFMLNGFNNYYINGITKKNNTTLKQSMEYANMKNNETYILYYNQLVEYSLNMIEWINLPKEIDVRFMEMVLQYVGFGVFYKDSINDKYYFSQVAMTGHLDRYMNPSKYNAFGIDMKNVELTPKNSVICYNNKMRIPNVLKLTNYAERLSDIQRTIDIALFHEKVPYFIECNEKETVSIKQLFQKITNNEPLVISKKPLNQQPLNVINTTSQYNIDKLRDEFNQVWNQAMMMIGINNSNQDKKERLVTDEVNANNEQIEQSRYTLLNARREFCKKINEMYGLNIWCKFRNNQDETESEYEKYNDEFKNAKIMESESESESENNEVE